MGNFKTATLFEAFCAFVYDRVHQAVVGRSIGEDPTAREVEISRREYWQVVPTVQAGGYDLLEFRVYGVLNESFVGNCNQAFASAASKELVYSSQEGRALSLPVGGVIGAQLSNGLVDLDCITILVLVFFLYRERTVKNDPEARYQLSDVALLVDN